MDHIAEFEKLVKEHDFHYTWSDDFRVWKKGRESWEKICRIRELIPAEDANRIWNAGVDRNVVERDRKNWYWR